jgi:hypothetical protein
MFIVFGSLQAPIYGRIFRVVEKVPAIVGPSFRLCIEIHAPVDASH